MTAVSVRPAVSYRSAAPRAVVMRPVAGTAAGVGAAVRRPPVCADVAVRPVPAGAGPARRAPAGVGASARRSPVRLTRRGRAVVVGLFLNLTVAVVAAVLLLAGSGSPDERHAATSTVVVQSGDTLWGIATQLDPRADPRATMAELRRLNGLTGSTIQAGQELILPVR
jgi:nucleoid-associated protein YgaU